MPLLVTTAGIDAIVQAFASRPNTLKFRLLQALRRRLPDNATIEATTAISAEELIAEVWQLDDPGAIKAKRKNFSSLKSALNRDLARLEREGRNPESLVLGRTNVFEVSGRKKEELIRNMGIGSGADAELAAQFAEFRREFADLAKQRGWNRLQDLLDEIEHTRKRLQDLEQRLAREEEAGLPPAAGAGEQEGPDSSGHEGKSDAAGPSAQEEEIPQDGEGSGEGDGAGGDEEAAGEEEEEEEEDEEVIEIDDDQQLLVAEQDPGDDEEVEIVEIDEDQEIATIDSAADAAGPSAQEEEIPQDGEGSGEGDGAGGDEEAAGEEEGDEEVIEIDDDQQILVAEQDPGDDEEVETVEIDEDQEIATIDSAAPRERPRNLFDALAEYLDPEQALATEQGETLDETEEEYLARLLSRFTPRFIAVPAGRYRVGSDRPGPFERPAEWVELPAFHIGQTPVTNDLFDLFVRETGYITQAEEEGFGMVFYGRFQEGHTSGGRRIFRLGGRRQMARVSGADWRHPEGPGSTITGRHDHPVVQVSRRDALAFAAWAGKRLPSEEEWEAAVRGPEGLPFPWGEEWQEDAATVEGSMTGTTTPVTAHGRRGASPFGVLDGIGNVYEWTGSLWRPGPGRRLLAILKGGAWLTPGPVPSWHRMIEEERFRANIVGFRCAV